MLVILSEFWYIESNLVRTHVTLFLGPSLPLGHGFKPVSALLGLFASVHDAGFDLKVIRARLASVLGAFVFFVPSLTRPQGTIGKGTFRFTAWPL